jgi:Mg2+/Co2+ transporter CorB
LILNRFGRIPSSNDPFKIEPFEILVLERKQNILMQLQVRVLHDLLPSEEN